ncbi:formate dehydrogenase subunit gamma [Dasania marina]|uniref:formate dehydrogenase subunit gamma n=1 Tax=Dasania marina TaxID=471499 RepID=UPI000362C12A|nr:formate dehydrogenase subunit gamma [Dasania marina]
MTQTSNGSELAATINSIIAEHKTLEGPLLPILHASQQALGYIPSEAVPMIAEQLQLTKAEVHGVISFYHFFRSSPAGNNTIQICRAESCQSMGSRELEAEIKQRLKVDYHQTTADGEITLEPVYCLGNCACSPAIRVNDDIHGRVDMNKFENIVDELLTVAVELKL